ncbi:hypothetical protein [Schaalia sp. lx-100]|uniref:hypothetical protein n=1 Tax=Schaalia sp. lx-100 TaxID=2899081 RepID=UPI001E37BC46|nr:hypothetical protein [Schaalia sp. lx-100]MCD4557999.1 hypothetical protein [Schaalia sp. lx-100]
MSAKGKIVPIPSSFHAALSSAERKYPSIELSDGHWLIAGTHELLYLATDAIIDRCAWHEIQSAQWTASSRSLSILWTDPQREPFHAITRNDNVTEFMTMMRERIEYTIIMMRHVISENGTRIVAQIRRAPTGELFSVLSAFGTLNDEGQKLARRLEYEVRESVGLE